MKTACHVVRCSERNTLISSITLMATIDVLNVERTCLFWRIPTEILPTKLRGVLY